MYIIIFFYDTYIYIYIKMNIETKNGVKKT